MKYFMFLLTMLYAANVYAYEFKAVRVIDGDTIQVEVPWNMPENLKISIRVIGIDTPEKAPRAQCVEENELAQQATLHTKKLVQPGTILRSDNVTWDKYGGRILADVWIGNINLAESLIKQNLARAYHGEAKQSWCK